MNTTNIRHKIEIPIPSDIVLINNIFKANNFSLYLVGGSIRDFLLNQPIKDYDLATDALPDKVEEMMQQSGLRTLPTGKAFGVINVFTSDGEYEIATFRSDGEYTDSRHPDKVTFTTIESDVMRRDLTINALFYDITTNEIVDLVGGIDDIKNSVIRTVGNPKDRFDEDRIRILRSIRFSARFNANLDLAIHETLLGNSNLDKISGERIRDEFIKGITSAKSVKFFLSLIDKYDLFMWVFKGLVINKEFVAIKDPIIVIATLLKYNDVNVIRKTLNELKYGVDEIKCVVFLINLLKLNVDNVVMLKRVVNNLDLTVDQINSFGTINNVDVKLLNSFNDFTLTVSGEDIMEKMGVESGPEVGRLILQMETDNFRKLL